MSDRWGSGECRCCIGIDAVRPVLSPGGCPARDGSAIIGAMWLRLITGPVRAFLAGLVVFLFLPQPSGRAVEILGAESRNTLFLGGQLLVASPEIGDPRFAKTVIYMVYHDQTGALGLIVNKIYAMTTEMSVLKAIAEGSGPRRSLFALGYSGWGAGQLESEIVRGDWFSAPADENLIFDEDLDGKWEKASGKAGLKL